MKKFFAVAVSFIALLLSCGKETERVESGKVCTPETVLAEGKGIKLTLADYEYASGLVNEKARKFYRNHPRSLLEKMVNRRLVIAYVKEKGLYPQIRGEIEEFEKEYLSRLYVSRKARETADPVTEEEIEKRFRELVKGKKNAELTPSEREFIRNELKVKHFDEAVDRIYKSVLDKVKISVKGKKVTASCCGLKVSVPVKSSVESAKEKAKEELLREYFYRKAVESGLNKDENFRRMLTEYTATKAIRLFRKELKKGINVTEEEAKKYYQKNRDKFKMPERAKVVAFYFSSEKKAKEAADLLKKETWSNVARRFGFFNVRPRVHYKDPKDVIGALVFGEGLKPGDVTVADLGNGRFVVLKVLSVSKEGAIPFEKAKGYIKRLLADEKLREKEKEVLKGMWKEKDIKLKNLECLRRVEIAGRQ